LHNFQVRNSHGHCIGKAHGLTNYQLFIDTTFQRIKRFRNRKRMITQIKQTVHKKSHCNHSLSTLGPQPYLNFFFPFCCLPMPTASVRTLRRPTPLRHTHPVARRNSITPAVHLPLYATLYSFPVTLSLPARPCPEHSASDCLSYSRSGRD